MQLLKQNCLTTNIVYKAKVTSSNQNYQEKVYFGSCEATFKKRFLNHKKSFNLNEYKNETELSSEIWRIKNSGHYPNIKWEIVKNSEYQHKVVVTYPFLVYICILNCHYKEIEKSILHKRMMVNIYR